MDPFVLLRDEDPAGEDLAAVIAQEGVDAEFSGAAMAAQTEQGPALTIEGTSGFGDEFMVGTKPRTQLPTKIQRSVERLFWRAFEQLGYVRFEWVAAKNRTWIVQFHRGISPSIGRTIFPGNPSHFVDFNVTEGLEKLRKVVARLSSRNEGVRLIGDVGITSHFGDVLRKARVPSIITPTGGPAS